MLTLGQIISSALDRKQVPSFRPGDVGDLATKLSLASPVSIAKLITTLDNLPPTVVTINIDPISTPGGVTASGQVGLQSDGAASFRGTANNPNAGEGINYLYAVALLDVKDPSGNVVAFSASGNLFNLLESSSSTFQQDGFSQFIANNWDAAKTSRYHAIIEASDNIFEDVVAVITEALAVVLTAGIILAIPGGDGPPDYSCQWANTGNDNQHDTPSLRGCYRLK